MSYKQSWGISRLQSPLNDNEKDKDIVEQNNDEAAMQTAGIDGSFFQKQGIKTGLKKFGLNALSKATGIAGMFLTSMSAQAGQLSSEQQREEMRSHGDLSKEEFDRINANQDGGELPFKNN